jgi:D-amino-acid oxidase
VRTTIAVIGGGVIGYTCAVRLAGAGYDVRVITADAPADTTTWVAAAIWFPYLAEPLEQALRWGARSLDVFAELARDPSTGVLLREGLVIHREPQPDLRWASVLDGHRPAAGHELPAGAPAGTVCTVPVIDTGRYLPWLREHAHSRGVTTERRRVNRLDEVAGVDVVVIAAGLGSAELVGDPDVYPVRGQIVRVANPGLTRWLLDNGDPTALTYVVPRFDDVVCGGTAEAGHVDRTPDPDVEAAILARAGALEPRLAGARVIGRAVGLRPARTVVRLESETVGGRRLVHCYGHGGAGVTLSWGCADDVVGLVADRPTP